MKRLGLLSLSIYVMMTTITTSLVHAKSMSCTGQLSRNGRSTNPTLSHRLAITDMDGSGLNKKVELFEIETLASNGRGPIGTYFVRHRNKNTIDSMNFNDYYIGDKGELLTMTKTMHEWKVILTLTDLVSGKVSFEMDNRAQCEDI